MMVPRFTGRLSSVTKAGRWLLLACLLGSTPVQAQPTASLLNEIQQAIEAGSQAWSTAIGTQGVQADAQTNMQMDEQIFTEISPVLDTPDAVKLPDDQRLED